MTAVGEVLAERHHIGAEDGLAVGERWLTDVMGRSVAVFRLQAGWVAYENVCPHSGGPVCEGQVRPAIRGVVDVGGRLTDETIDEDAPRLSCPWHGWDFDLATGVAIGDPMRRLRAFEVTIDNGEVYVQL